MTLKSRIEEIFERFERRRKMIDDTIEAINKAAHSSDKAIKSMTKAMNEMEQCFIELSNTTIEIKADYENFKEKIQKNRWMRLFGIK